MTAILDFYRDFAYTPMLALVGTGFLAFLPLLGLYVFLENRTRRKPSVPDHHQARPFWSR